jgi:hypoxanthine-guanine phosphoribosyltransferase
MDDFRTLIDSATIASRICELARDVSDRYADVQPCTVAVIEGARVFSKALMRHLSWPVEVHEVRASSYGDGMESSGSVAVTGGDAIDVKLEFVGFDIPNEFVIGFGMDVAGNYRDLDRIAIYEETRALGGG